MNKKEFETKQEEAFNKMFKWTDFSGDIGGYVLVKETSKYGTEETERQKLKSFLRSNNKLLLEEVEKEPCIDCGNVKTVYSCIPCRNRFRDKAVRAALEVPMEISQWRNHGIKYKYWEFFQDEAIEEIEDLKRAVAKHQGTHKYDSCYDECIEIIKYKKN